MKVKGNLQVSGTLEGITFSDGTTTFTHDSQLTFSGHDFYIGNDGTGHGLVHLKGINFTDGINTTDNPKVLHFNTAEFYLSNQTSTGYSQVNIRGKDYIPFEQETGGITNSWLLPNAPYSMQIEEVFGIVKNGATEVGFYIISAGQPHKQGISIPNLDPFYITFEGTTKSPTSGGTLSPNDALLLSVYKSSLVKNLRIGVKLRKV